MRAREWSWKKVHALYDRLRTKYYMDAIPPLHVPPQASELRWFWIPEASPDLGQTHFDEDEDPESIGINPLLRKSRSLLIVTLLHEMSHIRLGPSADNACDRHTKIWREETMRLANLGAQLL